MLTILNDVHIGVERVSGTTIESRYALRQHILSKFESLLPENDLMILGDLFDSYEIPIADLLYTYNVFRVWLLKGYTLYLVCGNHDRSKTSNVMSSFDFLGALLKVRDECAQVQVIKAPVMTHYGYVIPHLANQDLFNVALKEVPECDNLYLHCNYDNFFAAQSDQSLNISKEQAEACKAKKIVIGHEHQYKTAGKVLLPGNQIATSVADWQHCDTKYYLQDSTPVPHVIRDSEYIEQGWKDLVVTTHNFVRVVGDATVAESSQVVTAIAKFRAKSPAFVVSNAVNIESGDGLGDFANSLEAVTAFDVWRALGEVLPSSDMEILRGLR
ncbi:MAG: hypothetical protein QX198_08705 [Methylococcaceae bacterium]